MLLGSVLVGLEFLPGKSNHMFESENFRFPSSTKDLGKNWENYFASEMSKIKLQKIVGNLLDKFGKLYMNGTEQSSRNL